MSTIRNLALPLLIMLLTSDVVQAQKKPPELNDSLLPIKKPSLPKPDVEPLSNVVDHHFERWDRNHDKALDLFEIDHVIEDHSVVRRLAALAVTLRRKLTESGEASKNTHPSYGHDQLLKLVDEHDFTRHVDGLTKHLKVIDRELFLTRDPELTTFSQGRLNDCYLLSTIAAQVHRNPKHIRDMIHPEVTGGFHVTFGDGQKIEVRPLTEGELLLGAKLNEQHGSWLAVVEKAYGVIRRQERAKNSDKSAAKTSTNDFEVLNWGSSAVTIALMTGHHTETLYLNKEPHVDKVHDLLADLTKKRHLICVGKSEDHCPPGIVGKHAYAILGYNSKDKIVSVFNPWGNNFTPKGPEGQKNGWVTKNGHFSVPLDQFHAVFHDLVYETDKPLTK